MTSSSQLQRWMRFEPHFIGVFALDRLPSLPIATNYHSFIVNTHTHNLPGEHWIACRIVHDHAWIFDPLAYPPLIHLCQHLIQNCHVNHLNTYSESPIQAPHTWTCGEHCVYFLYHLAPAPSEGSVINFINKHLRLCLRKKKKGVSNYAGFSCGVGQQCSTKRVSKQHCSTISSAAPSIFIF